MPAAARKPPLLDGVRLAAAAAFLSSSLLFGVADAREPGGGAAVAERATPGTASRSAADAGALDERSVRGILLASAATPLDGPAGVLLLPPLPGHLGTTASASGHGAATAGARVAFLATAALGLASGLALLGGVLVRGVLARVRRDGGRRPRSRRS
jgi:hypothetical protein